MSDDAGITLLEVYDFRLASTGSLSGRTIVPYSHSGLYLSEDGLTGRLGALCTSAHPFWITFRLS